MQPKISIIIPVYNVEKYLRQCLDSVVNQTMQEIQIICVNDGSPDGSRAILQEYADRDSRIEIIDKPNGGLSSARNAAYPSIKGKYTLFVDSDDWIDLEACEKLFAKAEQTGAEIVFFFWKKEYILKTKIVKFRRITPQDKTTVEEKLPLLDFTSAWCKLWRSDFLFENRLYFPEGLCFEDCPVSWKGITVARRVSVLPEPLYHYRNNANSIVNTPKYGIDTVFIYNEIEKFLRESGHYKDYRDFFICQKLLLWQLCFGKMTRLSRAKMFPLIRESLTDEDRNFYRGEAGTMTKKAIWFYRGLIDGNRCDAIKYYCLDCLKCLERFLKRTVINPMRVFLENRASTASQKNGITNNKKC